MLVPSNLPCLMAKLAWPLALLRNVETRLPVVLRSRSILASPENCCISASWVSRGSVFTSLTLACTCQRGVWLRASMLAFALKLPSYNCPLSGLTVTSPSAAVAFSASCRMGMALIISSPIFTPVSSCRLRRVSSGSRSVSDAAWVLAVWASSAGVSSAGGR